MQQYSTVHTLIHITGLVLNGTSFSENLLVLVLNVREE